jgi:hypothetical protein
VIILPKIEERKKWQKKKIIKIYFIMRKELYNEIVEHLKNFTDGEEQIFKHFDLWNRQVMSIDTLNRETNPLNPEVFDCPACFIEFMENSWHLRNRYTKATEMLIRLHVVTGDYFETADYVPRDAQNRALEYLNLIDAIEEYMVKLRPSCSNSFLFLRKSIPNHKHRNLIDSISEYSCDIEVNIDQNSYSYIFIEPKVIKD